jgi:hypothetical protein
MQFYLRSLQILCHDFIPVVPGVIAKDMNPLFPRICSLYFPEKIDARSAAISGDLFPRECSVKIASSLFGIILAAFRLQNLGAISTSIYAPQNFESKIGSKEPKNRQKNLYGTLPNAFFDPAVGRLHIMRGMHSVHKTDRFISR